MPRQILQCPPFNTRTTKLNGRSQREKPEMIRVQICYWAEGLDYWRGKSTNPGTGTITRNPPTGDSKGLWNNIAQYSKNFELADSSPSRLWYGVWSKLSSMSKLSLDNTAYSETISAVSFTPKNLETPMVTSWRTCFYQTTCLWQLLQI